MIHIEEKQEQYTEMTSWIGTNQQNAILGSVAGIYLVMYLIRLADNSFCKLASIQNVNDIVSHYEDAQTAMNQVVERVVRPSSQKAMHDFVDLKTLPKRLEGKKYVSMDYQGSLIGWCCAKFIPVSYDASGHLKEVVYAVEHIHDRKMEVQIYQRVLERNADFIYYFDLTEGIVRKDVQQSKNHLIPERSDIDLPLEYDQFVRAYFAAIGWQPIKDYTRIYTRDEILNMYANGVTRLKTEYYASVMDRYFSSEFYLLEDSENGHIIAMVVRSDITREYRQEREDERALEQAREAKRLSEAALSAFSQSYLNVFIAAPAEDIAIIIKKEGYIPEGLTYISENRIVYSRSFEQYIETRIAEEDKERVRHLMRSETITQNLADKEEYRFTYHVQENGRHHDFEARIIRTQREGYYVIGFTNIDDLLAEEKRQKEFFRQAAENLKKSKIYLDAISRSYDYMVLSNLTRGTYTIPFGSKVMGWKAREFGDYEDLIGKMLSAFPENVQQAQRENRTIARHLERYRNGERYFEERYQLRDITGKLHWISERIMYAADEETGDILGISVIGIIDDEVRREKISGQVSKALSRDYTNVYLIKPQKNEVSPVFLKGYVVDGLDRTVGSVSPYWELVKAYVRARVFDEDRERFYSVMSPEGMEKALKDKDELVCPYRIIEDGTVHDYQIKIIKTGEDDTYILGFKNIDDLMVEERARQKLDAEMEQLTIRNRMLGASVMTIARLVDAKDVYTAKHSARVTKYSLLIGREIGLSEEEMTNLERSAMMHDIGKVAIPDGVLTKKGKLSKEEYRIMKSHPIFGYEILKEMDFAPQISEGAHYHHERYDGMGYPNGLRGDEIPLFGRIIGIADAYDAMSSTRVYRPRCDHEYILKEFRKGRGTQFDPQLCDIFIRLLEDGRAAAEEEEDDVLTLEKIFERFGGRYGIIKQRFKKDERIYSYLEEFLEDREFGKLKTALSEGDDRTAFRAVHTLKGVAMSLEMVNMEKICISLTENLRNNPINALTTELFEQLTKEYTEVCGMIRQLLQGNKHK